MRSIGPYTILEQLGRGGQGVVYLAEDARLKRKVALKVIETVGQDMPKDRLERFHREASARLLQEARAASALDHPNICAVYEVGEHEGQSFIAMAYVEGKPLSQLIPSDGLPPESVIRYGTQIADALAHAHERGIVHRDLKSQNVVITPEGRAKVLDFGLAARMPQADAEAVTKTQDALPHAGMLVGTLAYMAPEVLRGEAATARSDIWALGVLLYEMGCGRLPFSGATVADTAASILKESAHSLPQHVPPGLRAVTQRSLAKDSSQRYGTIGELRAVLEAITSSDSDEAGSVDPQPARVPSIAVLPFANMSADPENEFFADGISEEIINTLGQIEGLRVAARGSAFSFKGKHVDPREVGQKLQVSSVLEGSVRKAGKRLRITAELVNAKNGYQLWSERYDRELEDVFEIQDEIARTIADRLEVTLTGGKQAPLAKRATDNLNAYEAYLKGRGLLYKRGRFIFDALRCFEEAVELDPDYGLAWAGLADGRTTLGFYGMVAPEKTIPQAKEAATRAVQLDESLAEAHCALALATLFHDFDVPTSRREFRRAMELNPKYPQTAAWFALFVLSWIDGQVDEGGKLMTPIVEQDPLSGYNRGIHAWLLAFSGRYDEGIAEALAAVELDPESFLIHWILQSNYTLAGRYPEAVAAGHAALAVSGRHPWAMMTMGQTYADWGKRTEARALHDELMMRADSQWVSPAVRASSAATAGLTDDVVALITRAIAERDPFLMISMGKFPLTEWPRRVLREAGKLDEVRLELGLPSND